MSGAWVSRARLQAADGMPMPTKQMSLLRNARAAAMVIISLALWAIASSLRRVGSARGLRRLRGLAVVGTRRLACGTRGMHGERLRSLLEHVRLHPGEKAVAVAGDRVPGLVKRVVALVVAVRIGWMRPARHPGNGADGPARQDHGVGAALPEVVDDLLHRDERTLRRQHRLLLHTDDALAEHIAGAVGLEGVDPGHVRPDRRDRGEPLAGERTGDVLDVGVHLRQVDPEITAKDRHAQPRRPRR